MTIALSKEKLLDVLGLETQSATRVNFRGLEYDSREIRGGELFVALKGETSHGHDFVEQSMSRGAALCLIEDSSLLAKSSEPERLIVVNDTFEAFRKIAAWWRAEQAIPMLAISGSVGKTTCKELVASILLQRSRGVFSLKSHNNHVGVPYTLSRIGTEHEWAVVEMGMNHAGEISALSKLARPDAAILTAIRPAHMQSFGSLEEVRDAKLEILDGLTESAPLGLNSGDPLLFAVAKELNRGDVRFFGCAETDSVFVTDVETTGFDSISFSLHVDDETIAVNMKMPGKHNAVNAAAAALGARMLIPDLSLEEIKKGLEVFQAPQMRLNVKTLMSGKKVIDDSYNANPASMQAAIEIISDLKKVGNRVALIIGDMKELGSFSEHYHTALADQILELGPEFVVTVGPESSLIHTRLKAAGLPSFEAKTPQVAAEVARKLQWQVLLVKGSRSIGLDAAVSSLLKKEGEMPPAS